MAEPTRQEMREALEVMVETFGATETTAMLEEVVRARRVTGFMAEGMTLREAEEYAAEIEARRRSS